MIVSMTKSSPSLTWHEIVIFPLFQYEEQFKTILSGVRGDNNTKKLASQFTSRFFSKFPTLANDSLDAILDLCEDDNVDIRKQAIKDLPSLCREMKEFLPKIADVLSQLLQTEDKGEIVVIQNSLMSLFRRDAKGDLKSFINYVFTIFLERHKSNTWAIRLSLANGVWKKFLA